MARRTIQFLPENYYHIYNRGNNQQEIFLEDENYRHFLKRLVHYYNIASIEVVAFCLMPNHYHLLITLVREINFSNIMRSFTTSYVKSFNGWHKRVGHFFQGDFQARQIDSTEYLMQVCRYIHRNPVKAGLTAFPEEWMFSDYRRWIGLEMKVKIHTPCKSSEFLQLRNSFIGTANDYRKFVTEYVEDSQMQEKLKTMLF